MTKLNIAVAGNRLQPFFLALFACQQRKDGSADDSADTQDCQQENRDLNNGRIHPLHPYLS